MMSRRDAYRICRRTSKRAEKALRTPGISVEELTKILKSSVEARRRMAIVTGGAFLMWGPMPR